MTTVYIQNRSPHKILNDMTSKEAFIGKRPNVDNIWIFGCPIYIHIPKDKRKKLDPIGIKGIFVGYNTSSKEYKVYINEEHRIEVRRDVIFYESIAYKKSKDIPIDSNKEEEPIFTKEEASRKDKTPKPTTNHEEIEGPSDLCSQLSFQKLDKGKLG